MNFPYFISQRIRKNGSGSFSATVTQVGVASVAIGIAVLLLSFSILAGFKQSIRDKLFSLAAHVEVSKFSMNESFQETPLDAKTPFIAKIRQNPAIESVQLLAHKAGMLQGNKNIAGIVLKGVGQDFNWKKFESAIESGKKLNFSDSSYSKEIIISKMLAQQLELNVGEDAVVYFVQESVRARKLRIVGIYETGLEEFDKNIIVGDIALVQRLNGWDSNTVGVCQIFVQDFNQINDINKQIQDQLDHDLKANSIVEKFAPLFDWLTMLDRNMVIVLTLIFVVVGFNMVSVVLVLIMERTPMVGLLKALGSNTTQIGRVFFYTGIHIILRGLLWGNLLGLGICLVQYHFKIIPLDPQNYYISHVPIEVNWLTVLMLNGVIFVLISLVIVIPTFILPRISPIKALKFKD